MKAKLIIEDKEFEVEISKEEYKKIQITENKKTGYERAIKDDEFYYVSSRGHVEFAPDDYRDIDDDYYKSANYYSSDITAENNARADKLMRQLRRFAVEHRECGVNFNDTNTGKYYVYYDYKNDGLGVSFVRRTRDFGVIHFDSEETAQAAIEEFHDELIWYFTEYQDSL